MVILVLFLSLLSKEKKSEIKESQVPKKDFRYPMWAMSFGILDYNDFFYNTQGLFFLIRNLYRWYPSEFAVLSLVPIIVTEIAVRFVLR
jgi:hypothetical protein